MSKQNPNASWSDIRDGAPPPAFFEIGRRVLADAHKHLVPPLKPIDVLMLVGEAMAAKFFYPAAGRTGPPKFFAYTYHDISAVHALLTADPSYADKAEIIWAPDPDDQRYSVECALHAWIEDVFTPANAGPWCANPDNSPRAKAIRRQSQLIFEDFFKPDAIAMVENLTRAVVNNVGGSEWDVRDRERLEPAAARGWFKLVGDISETPAEMLAFEDGRLVVSTKATSRVLARSLSQGRDLDRRPRSLDQEDEAGNTLADGVGDERVAQPDEVFSLMDLRDVRDIADLKRAHPLLERLAERVEGDAKRAGDVGELLRRLVPVLDRLSDAALRAAIVYELGVPEGAGLGAWSRAEVAQAYGATVRELERRHERGREIAHRLRAA